MPTLNQELMNEARALAQELVVSESMDSFTAIREAVSCLLDMQAFATEWDSYVAEFTALQITVAT